MTTPNASEGANKDHNVADLNKLIRKCAKEALDIKAERKELNERAGDIRKRLCDSGVQPKAFDFAVKLKEMEAEVRNEFMDVLRLANGALGVGEQMTMLPDDPNGADAEAAHEVKTPETQH